jgi:FKBP-type peptidyl-prolyl cis-trans isomerase
MPTTNPRLDRLLPAAVAVAAVAVVGIVGVATAWQPAEVVDPEAPATRPSTDHVMEEAGTSVDLGDGLSYEMLAAPDADRAAREGDVVVVHYTGKLENGETFDTSRQVRPGTRQTFPTPIMLQLGSRQVIPGWERGLLGMKVGERRRLTIPPALAYGEEGRPPVIPPSATLIFDVELVGLARNAGDVQE